MDRRDNCATITGASIGASVGSAGGPIGASIGATIGANVGALIDDTLSEQTMADEKRGIEIPVTEA